MEVICPICNKTHEENQMVMFDEFGHLEIPRIACKSCFIEEIRKGFGSFNPGTCEVCGEKLVPFLDEIDDIFEEQIIWYQCSKEKKDDNQEHTSIGEYLLQPEDNGDETSWNG